jgi:hypothetical protein
MHASRSRRPQILRCLESQSQSRATPDTSGPTASASLRVRRAAVTIPTQSFNQMALSVYQFPVESIVGFVEEVPRILTEGVVRLRLVPWKILKLS